MSPIRVALTAAAVALSLGACKTQEAAAAPETVMPGKIEDMTAFDGFIAGKPAPAAFRTRYPDVKLVLPGEISTKEMRMDHSRYFAQLDDQGRIVGGGFR